MLTATENLSTPAAVVDEEVAEHNLARMAAIAADSHGRLRPHAKTHRSRGMARRQMARGAVGLTVATLTGAEVFADAGVDDLLLAHRRSGG